VLLVPLPSEQEPGVSAMPMEEEDMVGGRITHSSNSGAPCLGTDLCSALRIFRCRCLFGSISRVVVVAQLHGVGRSWMSRGDALSLPCWD
jgi:hypothetical protein